MPEVLKTGSLTVATLKPSREPAGEPALLAGTPATTTGSALAPAGVTGAKPMRSPAWVIQSVWATAFMAWPGTTVTLLDVLGRSTSALPVTNRGEAATPGPGFGVIAPAETGHAQPSARSAIGQRKTLWRTI